MSRISFLSPTVFSGGRNPQTTAARNLDTLIGFLGFFTLLAFAWTVHAEITGQDAALEALILLGLVLILVGLWRIRRRLN